jgi:hypothetical protein
MSGTPRSAGSALLEALVAFAVLSIGLLAVTRLHGSVQQSAQGEAERAQALRAAEHELETLRSAHPPDFASGTASRLLDAADEPRAPRLRLDRLLADDVAARDLAWATVQVQRADRPDAWPPVLLHSALSRADPALSGALLLSPEPGLRVHGRAPSVPVDAVDRGDGQSIWRPAAGLPLAFVIDNVTGRIVARCDLDPAAPAGCTPLDALLLTGWVRVSLAAPPDAAAPDDAPLALDVALRLTRGRLAAPGCSTERVGAALAYHCIIEPAGGAWSGRSDIAPHGWSIGTAAGQNRVCRYVAATGAGTPHERNAAHPARYENVDRPLMQQNFLVIPGDAPCPAVPASPAHPDGIVTMPHQP